MTPGPLISVCICTYRRPWLLERLLTALAAQEDLPGAFEVIVVDNDDEGSANGILAAARHRHPGLALRTAREPRKNIAHARNRSVALAEGAWIAFVDDDEEPGPTWLAALYRTARAFAADGVSAPVVPRVPDGAAGWIVRGRFFERPRHPTGAQVPIGELRTGNLLIRRELLVNPTLGPDGPFDPAFGLSGGEDNHLLGRLASAGACFVWCDDAPVHEVVPEERATLRYLLRNAYRGGHTYARQQLRGVGQRAVPTLVLRGGGAAGAGAVLAVASLPFGIHRSVRWARIGVAGAAKLLAITGLGEGLARR